jgi:two-component system, NarL family, sensor histidine kinase UhpB
MKICMKEIFTACGFSFIVFFAMAQQSTIDSLKQFLPKQHEDSNKVNTLIKIADQYISQFDYENALSFINLALPLSQKIFFKKGEGYCYLNKMFVEFYLYDNIEEATKDAGMALNIFRQIDFKPGTAEAYKYMGIMKHYMGNWAEATRNTYEAIKLFEASGNLREIAAGYAWLGFVYYCNEDYQQSFDASTKAIRLFDSLQHKGHAGECYIYLGNVYKVWKNYPKALWYDSIGLQMALVKNNPQAAANAYYSMGDIATAQAVSPVSRQAEEFYHKSLKNFKLANDPGGTGDCYARLSEINTKLHQLAQAQSYADSAMLFAKKVKFTDNLRFAYLAQSKVDSAKGNFKQAFEAYKNHIFFKDSAINAKETRKSTEVQMQYEFDKKQAIAKTEQEKKEARSERTKYILMISFVSAGIIAFLLFNRYRLKKRSETQQALLIERLRISRELHDEVGATLSGVSMYSHLTKTQLQSSDLAGVENSLNIMQYSSAQMVNKLNDIVWLMNPDQDSLQKLIQRLEEYARNMASVKNMQVKVDVPADLQERLLPVEKRRNIYLFCKEAINNAVKYSEGTTLELCIKECGGNLEFAVSDNGKGFDAVMVRRGNGLDNMQKRADEMGATLMLKSKKNEGVVLSLQIALA